MKLNHEGSKAERNTKGNVLSVINVLECVWSVVTLYALFRCVKFNRREREGFRRGHEGKCEKCANMQMCQWPSFGANLEP